ncbi:MAG: hypothetical protein F4138_04890 [Acidimicrobiia bacterium]|nr:hypothetical protein [Acidimicrobiia bacterium]MYC58559.1 hypothetical protein [Acidimicrobiia bacterium]MYG94315.1 hypothetical protein [Acidimicrobiia bacterium]MYI30334.1 hypothetical protein [Acidimicrobiia bacterium]
MLESVALRRAILGLAALAGATAVILAVLLTDTDSSDITVTGNASIDALIPPRNAEVLSQDNVGIDLVQGYEVRLVLNGIELPRNQIRHSPDINRYTFRPDQGKAVESLRAEQNCIQATYWHQAMGPSDSTNITWCFTAS